MAADGIGPSFTCSKLVIGAQRAGANVDLLVNRSRNARPVPNSRSVLPGPLARLPYKWVSSPASRALEAWYLNRIEPGDLAWLWPSVSLATHERLAERGIPILLEGINTRMAAAKRILDTAYDAIDARPDHGISDARVAEEEQKIALARTIFAPSPAVEAALAGSALENRFVPSSYGVEIGDAPLHPAPEHNRDQPVTFLFCGYACVRKGAHHLLNVWPRMPANARLRLVGRIEPLIAERYADTLTSGQVEVVGFTRNVAPHYATADAFVFPSLEEGDPLVTYEAALHGLPIIASGPGAGRIGAERDCATIIEPSDEEMLLDSLMAFYSDRDRRIEDGRKSMKEVRDFDWNAVAARRLPALESFLSRPPEAEKTPPPIPAAVRTGGPAISVVLPAYNRADTILPSIHSVLRQTFGNFELLVVDDGSTDNTMDVVRGIDDSRIRLMATPQNMGPSGARNVGIRSARADWVAFQDSDDEWLPEKLERKLSRLATAPADCVAVYCGMAIVGSVTPKTARTGVQYIPRSSTTLVEGHMRTALFTSSLISTQMLMARKSDIDAVGGFDESLQALVDWDLVLRLSKRGPFAFVDEPLVLQRFSANSITRDQLRRTRARARILEKYHDEMLDLPELLSRQYRILASECHRLGAHDDARHAIVTARHLQPRDLRLLARRVYLGAAAAVLPSKSLSP